MEIALNKCHLMGCITQSQSLPIPVIENKSPGRSTGSLSQPATGWGRGREATGQEHLGFPPGLAPTRATSYWAFLKAFAEGRGSLPKKDVTAALGSYKFPSFFLLEMYKNDM